MRRADTDRCEKCCDSFNPFGDPFERYIIEFQIPYSPQPFTLEFIPSRKTRILNCIEVVIAH